MKPLTCCLHDGREAPGADRSPTSRARNGEKSPASPICARTAVDARSRVTSRDRPCGRRRTAEQRDELAPFYAEHEDFLPHHDTGFAAGSTCRRTVSKSLG